MLEVKGSFDARYSTLAQWISMRIPDRRQAEGYFILIVAGLIVGFVILNYVGWAFIEPYILADTSGRAPYLFFGLQSTAALLLLSISFWGFRPHLNISFHDEGFQVEQGSESVSFAYRNIQDINWVDPVDVHRHFKRFSQCRIFSNGSSQSYLFMRLPTEVVLIGAGELTPRLKEMVINVQYEQVTKRPSPVI